MALRRVFAGSSSKSGEPRGEDESLKIAVGWLVVGRFDLPWQVDKREQWKAAKIGAIYPMQPV